MTAPKSVRLHRLQEQPPDRNAVDARLFHLTLNRTSQRELCGSRGAPGDVRSQNGEAPEGEQQLHRAADASLSARARNPERSPTHLP